MDKTQVVASLSLNLVSSISIIQVNKYIYVNFGFPNMGLTCLHFIITFIGLVVCNLFGMFEIPKIPISKMLPMSISFCGFVVLTNYSLQYNSIGTYQCLKSLTIPGVMLISMFFYSHSYSNMIKLSVLPVLIGVLINSIFDLNFNLIGLVLGLSAATVTSLYQVWIGEKQKELKINAIQLLAYQAPLSAILLFGIIPFFEPLSGKNGIFYLERSNLEWIFILGSGIIAFLVNVSIYWIIGITSALTYNMAGNVKFSLTIIIGCFIFSDPMKLEQIFAIVLVTIGLVAYTLIRLKETNEKTEIAYIRVETESPKEEQV